MMADPGPVQMAMTIATIRTGTKNFRHRYLATGRRVAARICVA